MKPKIWGFIIVILALVAYANLAAFLGEREEAKMKEAYEESVRKATAEVEREMARLEKLHGPQRQKEREEWERESQRSRQLLADVAARQKEHDEFMRRANDPAFQRQRAINAANFERVMNPQRVVYIEREDVRPGYLRKDPHADALAAQAEAHRRQLAQLAAEQAALRDELQEARQQAAKEKFWRDVRIDKLQRQQAAEAARRGESYSFSY